MQDSFSNSTSPLLEIKLFYKNDDEEVYYSGEKLRGRVGINFGPRNEFNVLRIEIEGRAKNSWLEEINLELNKIEEEEEYFNFEAEICIEDSFAPHKTSEYGFEYELSKELPSSFCGTYGSISYNVNAHLINSKTGAVSSLTKVFILHSPIDLNEYGEEASKIAQIDISQSLLFETGSLGMDAKIFKSGFILGEKVYFDTVLKNTSRKEIKASLYLIKEMVYHANERKVAESEVVAMSDGPFIKPNEETSWNGFLIEIPQNLNLPCLKNCRLIDMSFKFLLELEIPTPNINLEGIIPILIGHLNSNNTTNSQKEPEVRHGIVLEDISNRLEENTDEINKDKEKSVGDPINDTKVVAKNKKCLFLKERSKRRQTTCLVFRPEKQVQKLPTPKPETWKEDLAIKLALKSLTNDTPTFVVAQNSERPKWPDAYIVKKPKESSSRKNSVEKQPPPKPMRQNTQNKDLINNVLPYPKEAPNFPLPDFSFNNYVGGERRDTIGWSIKKNTLSLKRSNNKMSNFFLPLPTVGWSSDQFIS